MPGGFAAPCGLAPRLLTRLRPLIIASMVVLVIMFVWTTNTIDEETFGGVASTFPTVMSSSFLSPDEPPHNIIPPNPDIPPPEILSALSPPSSPPPPSGSSALPGPEVNLLFVDDHPQSPPAALFGDAVGQKPTPLFILVGDSTTNGHLHDGGGWGDAFLWLLMHDAEGINRGINGAMSVNYHESTMWADVISKTKAAVPFRKVYVTIQFGHNDQNPAANVTLDMYQDALAAMAREVIAAGGTPMLLSPLARRDFTAVAPGAPLTVVDNLGEHREATRRAFDAVLAGQARDAPNRVRFVNLNAASLAYIAALGQRKAFRYNKYNSIFPDTTHLNEHGALVFGRIVADLMLGHPPALIPAGEADPWAPGGKNDDDGLSSWIEPNPYLSGLIWHGDAA